MLETISKQMTDESMLNPVDREVLVYLLLHGDDTPKNIGETIERHPNSVRDAFDRMGEDGLILEKGGGVYSLTTVGANSARYIWREYDVLSKDEEESLDDD